MAVVIRMEKEEMKLHGKLIISGKVVAETGLHIGGTTTALDIGGMDNPIIKDAKGVPYIPGSSLKGKMRALLEKSKYPLRKEEEKDGKGYFTKTIHVFKDSNKTDEIIKIFGMPAEKSKEQVRGIFRDSHLDEKEFENNKKELFKNLELEYTEGKWEVSIDRITSKPPFGPRQLERVPKGARFDFEIILNIYKNEDKELLKTILEGMKLIEDDYLGGSGSRGSGRVSFQNINLVYRGISFYEGVSEEKKFGEFDKLNDLLGKMKTEQIQNWWKE